MKTKAQATWQLLTKASSSTDRENKLFSVSNMTLILQLSTLSGLVEADRMLDCKMSVMFDTVNSLLTQFVPEALDVR